MAERPPVVLIGNEKQELPFGDNVGAANRVVPWSLSKVVSISERVATTEMIVDAGGELTVDTGGELVII